MKKIILLGSSLVGRAVDHLMKQPVLQRTEYTPLSFPCTGNHYTLQLRALFGLMAVFLVSFWSVLRMLPQGWKVKLVSRFSGFCNVNSSFSLTFAH